MSNTSSIIISNIYKSRKNLLDQLKKRGFKIDNYNEFSINEIQIMHSKEQLDMLIENEVGHKIYVKYHINKKISPNHIYTITSDLFDMENILNKKTDEIIFISNDEVNEGLLQTINQLYNNDKIYINIVNIKRLLFNILEHNLVPKHEILQDDEKEEILKKYRITNMEKELPSISRFDPVSIAIGLRPGQICEITRPSKTAIITKYYRYCK
jgi:DNA-directed RNA polymerases I, II, and III subunit RPABC1